MGDYGGEDVYIPSFLPSKIDQLHAPDSLTPEKEDRIPTGFISDRDSLSR
jgi:hypothetical protein